MQSSGIWWKDLPQCEHFVNKVTGNDELCWNHVVGSCKFGNSCHFSNSHVDGKKLPTEFVEKVVGLFKPGIEAMLSSEYDRRGYVQQKYGGGGPSPKKARR